MAAVELFLLPRTLRDEAALLADLAGLGPAAPSLVRRVRDYATRLRTHLAAEEELLWPPLLARLDLEADAVLVLQQQRQSLLAELDRVEAVLTFVCRRWRPGRLAATLRAVAVHVDRVDGEEEQVIALVATHLTVDEWCRFMARSTVEA